MPDAVVIGAGPNGLVAANVLADAGWSVHVLEAQPEPGGAVRSAELVEPGFVSDLFSAFYPLAAASPAFRSLELERYGLEWCHGPLVLAHPSSDGSCVVLSRDLDETAASLDAFAPGDGDAWRELYGLWERIREPLLDGIVTPLPPVLPAVRVTAALRRDLVRFLRLAVLSVRRFGDERFAGAGAARLIAGNALHADLTPESPPGAFYGWFLTVLGQDVGFPFPRGGAGSLTRALVERLRTRGGEVTCSAEVAKIIVRHGKAVGVRTAEGDEVTATRAILADVDVNALYLRLLEPEHVPDRVVTDLRRHELDASTVKIDWTLDGPIPWLAPETGRSPVVHLVDSVDELTLVTGEIARGLVPGRPFLVFGQYSMGDETRCPPGKEVAWAYTHVPQRITGDAGPDGLTGRWDERERELFVARIEERVERAAPGFGGLIRQRHVMFPRDLEARDANLVNGALNGGTAQLHQQFIFRPTPSLGRPETPVRGLYLASASAHPGGGVHGGPGAIAARAVLNADRARRTLVALGAAGLTAAAARKLRSR
jgi:phytoene dehydrogenase-like protein